MQGETGIQFDYYCIYTGPTCEDVIPTTEPTTTMAPDDGMTPDPTVPEGPDDSGATSSMPDAGGGETTVGGTGSPGLLMTTWGLMTCLVAHLKVQS